MFHVLFVSHVLFSFRVGYVGYFPHCLTLGSRFFGCIKVCYYSTRSFFGSRYGVRIFRRFLECASEKTTHVGGRVVERGHGGRAGGKGVIGPRRYLELPKYPYRVLDGRRFCLLLSVLHVLFSCANPGVCFLCICEISLVPRTRSAI